MGLLAKAISSFSEKRFHPAKWPRNGNLERWLITGETDDKSYTGKTVDEESAMTNTAVWSAVTQLSQTKASLPLHLYMRINEDDKKKAINHRNYNLLHLKTNPFMSAMSFRECQMGQVLRYGTCFAEKELDGNGNIIALWPLLSAKVRPDVLLNDIVYVVSLPNGKEKVLDKSRILRVNGFSSNGLIGYSPVEFCKESIALSLAIEEYGARFYGNGARPAAVLEHPAELSQEAQDRLRKNWNKVHEGLENSHRIAILEEGMKLHEFTVTPEDSQTLETRKFQVEEVARIFNMPVHMLKELTRSTNNNIEYQSLEFIIYSLRPWLVKFEQEYTIQLLTEKEQKKYFYEHSVDGLLRGDAEKRHKTYAHGRQWGYYSINDIRRKENLNSIGPEGDKYLVPMNMVPIDKMDEFISGKNEKQNNNPAIPVNKNSEFQSRYINKRQIQNLYTIRKRIQGFYSRIFADSINTILNRESLAIQRAFKKHRNEVFSDWIDSFFEDHYAYVRKIISPVILSFSEQVAHQSYDEIFIGEDERDLNIESIVEKTIDSFVSNHINRSQEFFKNVFSQSNNIINSIEKYISDRCDKDSENETFRICNIICNYIFSQNGSGTFIRIIRDDPCDNCKDLDCKPVNENEIDNYCCCIVTG